MILYSCDRLSMRVNIKKTHAAQTASAYNIHRISDKKHSCSISFWGSFTSPFSGNISNIIDICIHINLPESMSFVWAPRLLLLLWYRYNDDEIMTTKTWCMQRRDEFCFHLAKAVHALVSNLTKRAFDAGALVANLTKRACCMVKVQAWWRLRFCPSPLV